MKFTRRQFGSALSALPVLAGTLGARTTEAIAPVMEAPAPIQPVAAPKDNSMLELVARTALDRLQKSLLVGNLVYREYEPEEAQHGHTVEVIAPPLLVAYRTEDPRALIPQRPEIIRANLLLNRHVEATFSLPTAAKGLNPEAFDVMLDSYILPATIAITERIETDLLSLATQFNSVSRSEVHAHVEEMRDRFSRSSFTFPSTPAFHETMVDCAEVFLFNAKVPAAAPKHLVVSGKWFGALRQEPRFTGEPFYREHADGKFKDFFVYRSPYVHPHLSFFPMLTGTKVEVAERKYHSTDISNNLAFAKQAIAMVIRRPPFDKSRPHGPFAYAETEDFGLRVEQHNDLQFTISVFYGYGVLRKNFGVLVPA